MGSSPRRWRKRTVRVVSLGEVYSSLLDDEVDDEVDELSWLVLRLVLLDLLLPYLSLLTPWFPTTVTTTLI